MPAAVSLRLAGQRRSRLALGGDERLVARLRAGDDRAFEAIYDRYHAGLLAFCRHMLGSREEAEDVLQHTFVAAYRALTDGDQEVALRPWLYAIARNRALSVLRARRDAVDVDSVDAAGPELDGLAGQVQRRTELRELVDDMQRLPEEQRAALVLFELGDHSHDEIAEVLGVRREKVKALVFQARETLVKVRTARDRPCHEVREELAVSTARAARRGSLGRHLEICPACAAFAHEVRGQRNALAAVLPVVPTLGLKAAVLGSALGGGGAAAVGAGLGGAAVATSASLGAGAGAGGSAAICSSAVTAAATTAGTASAAGSIATGIAVVGAAGASSVSTGLAAIGGKAVVAKILTVVAVSSPATGPAVSATREPSRVPAPPALVAPAGAPAVQPPHPTIDTSLAQPAPTPASTTVTAAPAAAEAAAPATAPSTETTSGVGASITDAAPTPAPTPDATAPAPEPSTTTAPAPSDAVAPAVEPAPTVVGAEPQASAPVGGVEAEPAPTAPEPTGATEAPAPSEEPTGAPASTIEPAPAASPAP